MDVLAAANVAIWIVMIVLLPSTYTLVICQRARPLSKFTSILSAARQKVAQINNLVSGEVATNVTRARHQPRQEDGLVFLCR